MNWLAKANTKEKNGKILIKDLFILEWVKTDILSPEILSFKKDLAPLAAEKISESELKFLKKYPNAASSELFLMACKPLLENGLEKANFQAIKNSIKDSVMQFYNADLSKFGEEVIKPLLNDLYFCVRLKSFDEKENLGFLLFSITPAMALGDVKVINFFMKEEVPSLLRKYLMGIIFEILPETKRIFLFARPTDLTALEIYAAMGFKEDENPFHDPSHKINHQNLKTFEYRAANSKILQKAFEDENVQLLL
ncbi:hypothetical protein [Criblamydia sequanensis]|uniref:N-acetyltransferase domain-containing protein n=1 Tax=Candidatus Criblamydia sequanensis CRIB-18 TaxID=1437425 RepID=A0A090E070_9BACT|nr:hypothetical protein [Criblamydia sequanensis]CDR34229.1 hypothetical protein CSEC_1410 [Criblamydia sequanensis CRIB-18]